MHDVAAMALRIATFNAGLAIGVLPHATERVAHVIDAIRALDVDVLFVQEFWLDTHWERLRQALASRLPHAFRPEPVHKPTHAACTAEELLPLIGCAEAKCSGLRDESLARCVVRHCAGTALALPTECVNCVARHPLGSLDEILAPCIGEPTRAQIEHTSGPSARYGGLIAYGGSFGTGLLSRMPQSERRELVFESTVNARGAIHALISAREFGSVHVFATHLSPGGAEQPPQVERLLDWIDELAEERPCIVIGDLNTSPGSHLFARFERAGFHDANASDPRGTYTPEGLSTGSVEDSYYKIDHVLYRNLRAQVQIERIFDQPLTISVQGHAVRTTLSDHFGLRATLQ